MSKLSTMIVSLTNQSWPVPYATSGYQEINKRAKYKHHKIQGSIQAPKPDRMIKARTTRTKKIMVRALMQASTPDRTIKARILRTKKLTLQALIQAPWLHRMIRARTSRIKTLTTQRMTLINFGRKPASSREGFRAAFRKAPTVIRDEIFRLQKTNKAWRGQN